MLGITDLGTYVLGTVAIILLPGPNTLFVLATAAKDGVRTGYRAAAGVFVGDWILMMATAAGVASVLRAFPPVFFVVKYAGAAYLTWIGANLIISAIRRWRAGPPAMDDPVAARSVAAQPVEAQPPVRHPFRRALMVSLLNPKAILFFLSFFIQFIDPAYPYPVLSFALLAIILSGCSFVYLSVIILTSTYLATQVRRRRGVSTVVATGVGAVFVGFGVKLATATLE